jgi:hypothetical protein
MGVMWERVAERRAGIVVMPDGRVFGESLLLKTIREVNAAIFQNKITDPRWVYYGGVLLGISDDTTVPFDWNTKDR